MPKKHKLSPKVIEFIKNAENSIVSNAKILNNQLQLYSSKHQVHVECLKYDYSKLFFKWATEFHENFELEIQGMNPYYQPSPDNLYTLSEESLILKSFNLVSFIPEQAWGIVIRPSFGSIALKESEITRKNILRAIIKLIGGYFNESKILDQIKGESAEFRIIKIEDVQKWILFSIEINRLPLVSNNSLDGFNYVHLLKLIDLTESIEKSLKSASIYLQEIKGVPEFWVYKKDIERLLISEMHVRHHKTSPSIYQIMKLSSEEKASYRYIPEIKRWRKEQNQKNYSQIIHLASAASQESQKILNQLTNSENCIHFASVMEKLESYEKSSQLSDEEKQIINESANMLIIGRSGTGKTTSAIFRMFATEIVYKKLTKIHLYRTGAISSKILTIDDINKKVDLHQIFITVSPLLTLEADRLYQNLINCLIASIKKEKIKKCKKVEMINNYYDPKEDWEVDLPKSLQDFEDEHFPAFIPIFNFLTRVDATLDHPFFAQDQENLEKCFNYHDKKKGMKMRIIETVNGSELISTFNIDFEYFNNHFWPRFKIFCDFFPITIWTEISSAIKGSPEAYRNEEGHISKEMYLGLGKKQSQIEISQRGLVWDIFLQYEAWKKRQNAYDFQDLVNHILRCIDCEGYHGSPIHFSFIDEVQDCSTNFLLLILKLTRIRLFFAGDTAQSITRGAGFRFCDLNSLFLEPSVMNHSQPVIKHLSVNYRSHQEILDVANVVIQLMIAFFPTNIDRLNRETSKESNHEKPVIVKSNYEIEEWINKKIERSSHIEFGWNQAILVRTPESRKRLPSFLKGAICLTILESKGLEFKDVFLYNFFNDSEVDENEWAVLFKFLTNDPNKIKRAREGIEGSLLCSELKHLYVGITRARKRLIFFDENDSCRKSLEKCWGTENLVWMADSMSWQEIVGKQKEKDRNRTYWKNQGLNLLRQGNYESAKTCFIKSGDKALENKVVAIIYAEEAKRIRLEVSSIQEEAKEKGIKLAKFKKEENKKRIQTTQIMFKDAAKLFEKIEEYKEAALCYSSAEDYENAARLFSMLNMCEEAGMSFYKIKRYREAEIFYKKAKNYFMRIKCLIFLGKYDKALDLLRKKIYMIGTINARWLLQAIIRGTVSGYFPEPFIDKKENISKIVKLYNSFAVSNSEFDKYLETSRQKDEFAFLSKRFYDGNYLSANNNLDPKMLFIILKHVATVLYDLQQRASITILYNQSTVDFIRNCQMVLPKFFNLFSSIFDPLIPLSLLLDSFSDLHTRICMLIANSLRLADLSCWYLISFIFKLSRPFIPFNEFKVGSYVRYKSALTALMFIDERFHGREVLGYGLAIAGFWKLLRIIPEKDCKNLMRLYFLDNNEYNKLLEVSYFKELKHLKILEQLITVINWKKNFTLKVNQEYLNIPSEGFFQHIQEMTWGESNRFENWIKYLFCWNRNIFDQFRKNTMEAIEYCVALSLMLMSSKEINLSEIKLNFDVAEMEAFIFIVENVIKLLIGMENMIEESMRSLVLEFILFPLGITIITPGKYTRLLPFATHVVMSSLYIRSDFILNKSNNKIYSFDIEGKYWLVPKDIIFKDVAKVFLHTLSELIYERTQYGGGTESDYRISISTGRSLEKKIEYCICVVGEISMLKRTINTFNKCGNKFIPEFGNKTLFYFLKYIGKCLGNLPFPCINLTKASKEALTEEAIKTLKNFNIDDKPFESLRKALLFLLLVEKESIYIDYANQIELKSMALLMYRLWKKAKEGKIRETCEDILALINEYREFIPEQEISQLFLMYCAYALLTCTYSFIPSNFKKKFYYCYPIEVLKNIDKYIKNPQNIERESLNIVLINNLIEIFYIKEDCLSKQLEKKYVNDMFTECLALIINSTKWDEYFFKFINFDIEHKAMNYDDKKLEEIFYKEAFDFDEIKYLYNTNKRIIKLSFNIYIYFTRQMGEDLLEFYNVKNGKGAPFEICEFFSNSDFNQYLIYKDTIVNGCFHIIHKTQSILDKKINKDTTDIITVQKIIRTLNAEASVFRILYGKTFIEEPYIDTLLEEINKLSQTYTLKDESLQAQQIQSNENYNLDNQEDKEFESESEENTEILVQLEDPIDNIIFNEDNIKLDEDADIED